MIKATVRNFLFSLFTLFRLAWPLKSSLRGVDSHTPLLYRSPQQLSHCMDQLRWGRRWCLKEVCNTVAWNGCERENSLQSWTIFMQIEDHFLSIAFHVPLYVTTVLLSSAYQINLWELGSEMEVCVAVTHRFIFFSPLSCSTDYEMAPAALLGTAVPCPYCQVVGSAPGMSQQGCWVLSWFILSPWMELAEHLMAVWGESLGIMCLFWHVQH